MKNNFTFIVLAAIIVLSGCWGGRKYKGTEYQEIKSIPEGKALVYIYRPYKFAGSALHYKINDKEIRICDIGLYNDSYIIYFADPGECEFWTLKREDNKHKAIFNVNAGETYYVECKFGELEQVDASRGTEKITKCQLIPGCTIASN